MKPTPKPTHTLTFRASGGYTLYRVGGEWTDSLNPDLVGMTFPAACEFWGSADGDMRPADHNGEPLAGHFVTAEGC